MTPRIRNDEFGCRICKDTCEVAGKPCSYCCGTLLAIPYEYLELKVVAKLQQENPIMLTILENMA